MKAMSLKVKPGGGGAKARARRRRRQGNGAEAEEDLEMQDKDIATAASTSASAKIAPEEERGGKRPTRNCDNCRSALADVAEEDEEGEEEGTAAGAAERAAGEEEGSDGEWVAEPEPGVLMTLVSRPDGTNHLRKLRFREELFDGPRAAQRWWADNYDCIVELYSIVQSTGGSPDDGVEDVAEEDEPATPCQSEDDHHHKRRRWQRLGCDSASTSGGPSSGSGSGSGGGSASTVGSPILGLVVATPNSSKNKSPGPPERVQSHKHKCRSLHIN
jgi:hypothetical protein